MLEPNMINMIDNCRPDVLLRLVKNLKNADTLSDLLRLAVISNKYQFESTLTEKVISDLLHHHLIHVINHLHETASVDLLKRALGAVTVQQSLDLWDGFSRIFATKILNKTFLPEARPRSNLLIRTVYESCKARLTTLFSILSRTLAPLKRWKLGNSNWEQG
jgi:hypothetical protein